MSNPIINAIVSGDPEKIEAAQGKKIYTSLNAFLTDIYRGVMSKPSIDLVGDNYELQLTLEEREQLERLQRTLSRLPKNSDK